ACLCDIGRVAAAGWHLWLSARRPWLRTSGVIASAGDRPDLRDLADGCGNGWGDGRRRRRALCATCQSCRLHRGFALPDLVAFTPEHIGTPDQREHSGGL